MDFATGSPGFDLVAETFQGRSPCLGRAQTGTSVFLGALIEVESDLLSDLVFELFPSIDGIQKLQQAFGPTRVPSHRVNSPGA